MYDTTFNEEKFCGSSLKLIMYKENFHDLAKLQQKQLSCIEVSQLQYIASRDNFCTSQKSAKTAEVYHLERFIVYSAVIICFYACTVANYDNAK